MKKSGVFFLATALLAGSAVAWPDVETSTGTPSFWSSAYSATKTAAKKAGLPCMVVLADSEETTANADWNTETLETDEWEDWLSDHQLYRVMLDRAKTEGASRQQWLSIASGFADKDGWVYLPLIVLYGPDGKKLTQFTPYNDDGNGLADVSAFTEVLEYYLDRYPGFIKPGPGRIGFTKPAVTVTPGDSEVQVTVTRSGGTGTGAQAFLLQTHDGSATNELHYEAVSNKLTWAAGDSSSRTVPILLLPDDNGWRQPSDLVFNVTLAKETGTAEIGTTNLTVTIASPFFTAGTNWVCNSPGTWQTISLASNETSDLSWKAPQAGQLTVDGGWLDEHAELWVNIPGATIPTNATISTISVALEAGARVVWTAVGGEVAVDFLNWLPLDAPVPVSPADGAMFKPADLPALVWKAPPFGTVKLRYGKTASSLDTVSTNAVSGVTAEELGLTNGVVYWRVDSVITGMFETVAVVAGPTQKFEITERPAFPSASTNVFAYLNIPARFQLETESDVPVTYSASGLPSGLTIGKADGVVSGTAKRKGTFVAAVTATSAKGTSVLTMTVTVEVLPGYASGSFQGMLDSGGMVTLAISSAGVPSLKIQTGGKTQTLKGVWQDAFTARFTTKAGDVITVALTEAGVEFTGLAAEARQVLTQSAAIAPYVGYYTGILTVDGVESAALDNRPEGYGYLTFTVAKTGTARYGGKLADGTSVSGSAKLTLGEEPGTVAFPLYKPLYTRRGEVAAHVAFATDRTVSVSAGAWHYPGKSAKLPDDGFAAEVSGTGAYYAKTVKAAQLAAMYTNSVLAVAGDEINLEIVKSKLAAEAGSGVKLSVTASTGLFTGSFTGDTGKRYTFRGALIPEQAYGAGYWLWPVSTNGYRFNLSQPVNVTP